LVQQAWWRAVVSPRGFSYAQSEEPNGTVRIALRGDLDIASGPSLEAVLRSLAASPVLLGLEHLAFLDSMGVAVLVRAHLGFQEAGGALRMTGQRGEVSRCFEIMGFTQPFEFDD
jgi:anti-anti-sigma factor